MPRTGNINLDNVMARFERAVAEKNYNSIYVNAEFVIKLYYNSFFEHVFDLDMEPFYKALRTASRNDESLQGAALFCNRALIFTTNDILHGNLGYCYYRLNCHDSALAQLTQAINLNPNCALYYYDRALVHFKYGDKDPQVLLDCVKASLLDPESLREQGIGTEELNNILSILLGHQKVIEIIFNLSHKEKYDLLGMCFDGVSLLGKHFVDKGELLSELSKKQITVMSIEEHRKTESIQQLRTGGFFTMRQNDITIQKNVIPLCWFPVGRPCTI